MKRPKRVLIEWAGDEIVFKGWRSDKEVWTQEEFEKICSIMGRNPDGVPLLREVVGGMNRAMRSLGWPQDRIALWWKNFFSLSNMVRFRSIYEVKWTLGVLERRLREASSPPYSVSSG